MLATSPSRARRAWVWLCIAMTGGAAAGLVATDAEGCFGSSPPPVCARTTVLVKVAPPVVVLPAVPGPVTALFPIRVTINTNGFCPPPLTTAITLTATCTPPPGSMGTVTIPTPAPGIYATTVPLTFPAGPQRVCLVAGTATTAWADGVMTTARGDTVVCLVDAAPGMPGVPRLDLQPVTPSIQAAHPGDQIEYRYLLTNNDPNESVTLDIAVDSEQIAQLPLMTGAIPGSGDGPYSIADPSGGDNFPIELAANLVPEPGPGNNYALDDGSPERQIGLGNEGAVAWLNQFDVAAGQEVITKVSAVFGERACPADIDDNGDVGFTDLVSVLAEWGPCPGCPEDIDGNGLVDFTDLVTVLAKWGPCPSLNGTLYSVLVYDDPDDDGDPDDAILLTRSDATVAAAGTGKVEDVKIFPTNVGDAGDSFFVGVVLQELDTDDLPVVQDTDSDLGRSWITSSDEPCDLDVVDLTANPVPVTLIGSVGLPGNFVLRAQGIAKDEVLVGWIEMPADPPSFGPPTITTTLTLCPGESREVCVASRSWLSCPPGSACESRIRIDGFFSDGSQALACSASAHIVDEDAPPRFDCPDGGTRFDPLIMSDRIVLEATMPQYEVSEGVLVAKVVVLPDGGAPLESLPPQTMLLEPSTGRIIISNRGPGGGPALVPGQPFEVFAEIRMESELTSVATSLEELLVVPAAPEVGPSYFSFMTLSDVAAKSIPPHVDAFLDGMLQIALDGVQDVGPAQFHWTAEINQSLVDVQILGPETIGVSFFGVFKEPIDDVRLILDVAGGAGGVDVPGGP